MPRNHLFNFFDFAGEQEYLQDVIEDAFSIYGVDIYYIPRNVIDLDQLYLADDQSTYTKAIPTVAYLLDYGGFGGSQNVFSKFGLMINDQITLSIGRRSFDNEVKPNLPVNQSRPNEGDLVYFALNKKCFIIRFTNNKEIFYELGKLPTYQITCELFEYSGETFNTGIQEIDSIQSNLSLDVLDNAITSEDGNTIVSDNTNNTLTVPTYSAENIDPVLDDRYITDQVNKSLFIDFSSNNPKGHISNSGIT